MRARAKAGYCNFFSTATHVLGKVVFFGALAYVLWVNARALFGDHFVDTLSQIGLY